MTLSLIIPAQMLTFPGLWKLTPSPLLTQVSASESYTSNVEGGNKHKHIDRRTCRVEFLLIKIASCPYISSLFGTRAGQSTLGK
ncbi:hypothetical protein NQ317_007921 [Molorchus minor]|uniref:Secreted protein n=1 Tax=Molorchus minor TaxID=1323400 RepID=A0ABQ9JRL0_9CUCU|nr:hypothetical protein NQ317_007921 [Molorchus minor]